MSDTKTIFDSSPNQSHCVPPGMHQTKEKGND
jgi:hypothetical protein